MRFFVAARKYGSRAAVLATASVGSAMAAVPADVTSALSDAKADGATVATAFVVAVIVIKALSLMKRA